MRRERSVLLSIVLFSLYVSLITCEIRVTPSGRKIDEEGNEIFQSEERNIVPSTLCGAGTFLYIYTNTGGSECVPQYSTTA